MPWQAWCCGVGRAVPGLARHLVILIWDLPPGSSNVTMDTTSAEPACITNDPRRTNATSNISIQVKSGPAGLAQEVQKGNNGEGKRHGKLSEGLHNMCIYPEVCSFEELLKANISFSQDLLPSGQTS